MSVVIQLKFPCGRYHATPWGHHVNEGQVEWPPSPWRLSRALVAVWHGKCSTQIDEEALASLVEQLAADVPQMRLPKSTPAHTRHYMPQGKLVKGNEKTALVFDTFLQLEKHATLLIRWPALSLDTRLRTALSTLLCALPYLGRAESWVDASLLEAEPEEGGDWVNPIREPVNGELFEVVKLLMPLHAVALTKQREVLLEAERSRALREKQHKETKRADAKGELAKTTKLTKKENEAIDAMLPATVLDVLGTETNRLKKQGWSGVPGTRWIEYARPRGVWQTPRPARRRRTGEEPTTARFEVTGAVLPRLTDAFEVGGVLRRALLKMSDGAPEFLGRGDDGDAARGGHAHGHYFSEALGKHGRITHLTVFARSGFGGDARRALERLRRLWGIGDRKHDLQLTLLGVGKEVDFAPKSHGAGEPGTSTLLSTAHTWVSRTPFVATRHLKERMNAHGEKIGSSADDLRRLLALSLRERGIDGVEVGGISSVLSTELGGRQTRWHQFKTYQRGRKGKRGASPPTGLRFELSEPIQGPFAVGFGSHFGLGQFVPSP